MDISAILGKIGFDWQVALANLFNFLIIFFILKKFAFGPIGKLIKERQEKIALGLENAKKAETELMMAEENAKEHISKAKMEANTIVGDAQKKGDTIISSSQEEAMVVKSTIIKDGERIVEQKKNSIRKEIENETANLVVNGMEKVLRETFTKDQQENYINKVLSN